MEKDTDIKIIHGGIRKDIEGHITENHNVGFYDGGMWFKNQVGSFWIHDKSEINFVENEGLSADDAAQFLPGMCLSILLWYRGDVMMHGACLFYKGKTMIISGNSGAGKSTLTTELINLGAKLIADDVTAIRNENGEYKAYPAFPAQKLCDDQVDRSGMERKRLKRVKYDKNKFEIPRIDVFCSDAKRIDCFYRIEKQDVELLKKEIITGAEKLRIITDSIFIKWMFHENFKLTPEDMIKCIGIANQVDIYRVIRPDEKDTLKDIIRYIDGNT
ncbi:MAG: hypothetical protein K5894_12470 [Lachnospiraceae bacterium]|nr:hypothetical protein [Lachnospiraceae bacterium]